MQSWSVLIRTRFHQTSTAVLALCNPEVYWSSSQLLCDVCWVLALCNPELFLIMLLRIEHRVHYVFIFNMYFAHCIAQQSKMLVRLKKVIYLNNFIRVSLITTTNWWLNTKLCLLNLCSIFVFDTRKEKMVYDKISIATNEKINALGYIIACFHFCWYIKKYDERHIKIRLDSPL